LAYCCNIAVSLITVSKTNCLRSHRCRCPITIEMLLASFLTTMTGHCASLGVVVFILTDGAGNWALRSRPKHNVAQVHHEGEKSETWQRTITLRRRNVATAPASARTLNALPPTWRRSGNSKVAGRNPPRNSHRQQPLPLREHQTISRTTSGMRQGHYPSMIRIKLNQQLADGPPVSSLMSSPQVVNLRL